MRLRLTVEAADRHPVDVVVDCDPDTANRELVAALASYLRLSPADAAVAYTPRTGTWLDPERPIEALQLHHGDRLELLRSAAEGPPAPGSDGTRVELVAVGGPAAGHRVPLAEGEHVVGRGSGADVVFPDSSMSRRHLVIDVGADEITVNDAGSSNGTYVAGAAVRVPHTLEEGELIEAGRTLLSVEPRRPRRTGGTAADGRVPFNRPPRIARRPKTVPPALSAPPGPRDSTQLPLGAAIIPLVLGGALAAVTGNPLLLLFALLTPAMAVWSYLEGRRSGRRRQEEAVETFRREVELAAEALREARREEAEARRDAAPDAAVLYRRATELAPELWERRRDDDDALLLRVGTADLSSEIEVELPPGGSQDLREEARAALDEDVVLHAMPVAIQLAGGLLGLAGHRQGLDGLSRWLVAQAATLNSPAELEIAAALAPDAVADWDWLKWLPHPRSDGLVTGAGAGRALLGDIAESGRRALVVVDGDLHLQPSLAAAAARAGGGVVWLGRAAHDLPGTCTHVVELDRDVARLVVVDVREGSRIDDVSADALTTQAAEELARLLAPIEDVGAEDSDPLLPARVSLLDLLGLREPTAGTVAERWRQSREHLRAPIGQSAEGPFELDAGRSDGLRLLLGGMPGAGKSELLQTLIASLAATHGPSAVTFLLVDYKGGAAFRDCVGLPHAVGLVTDLDEHLAERCRASLLAELRRRERLLRGQGAKSLRDLVRKDPEAAPPTLLIVVDEFATLVREVPSFVDTVVDVAQRGRSLGMHLILATQRPRGAINDAIRANTNLRIAMRMSDRTESQDVIEAPSAAAIPADAPGRAIALAGRRADGSARLTPFQAAYAGGRSAGRSPAAGIRVTPLRFGAESPVEAPVVSRVDGGLPTDLQRLVEATQRAGDDLEIPKPAPPWLPPLPDSVSLDELPRSPVGEAAIGLLDEPSHQRRRPLTIDLTRDGSVLVYGASGSGKTVLLQTLACALAEECSPRELQVFGLDFASGALRTIEALPHCGSVVRGDEEERMLRLIRGLARTLRDRKQRSVTDRTPSPRLVLLLDGYGAFAAAHERLGHGEPSQVVARLAAEGRPLGLHVVATADRRAEVPGALSGVVPVRVVLRMADAEESVALGAPRSAAGGVALPPGRGFTRDHTELQVALPGDISARGEALRSRFGHERAPRIGVLPTNIPRSRLPSPPEPLHAVVGLDDDFLQPVAVNLAEGHVLVAGPHRSGRTTTLATIAWSLRRGAPDASLHLLSPRRTGLAGLDVWTSAALGLDDAAEASASLAASTHRPLVVVVDDATELAEGPAALALETIVRRSRDSDVRLVAAVERHAVQRVFSGWLRELRADGRGLLLTPNVEVDGDLLGARLPRRSPVPCPPGRGFLVLGGAVRLVQVGGD